ncbi:MAG: DUF1800 family protein [Pyrinomonadaceae bacterium]
MKTRISRYFLRILTALALLAAFAVCVSAQGDPDPNSPTPILITQRDSARVFVTDTEAKSPAALTESKIGSVGPGAKTFVYVANLEMLDGEGANSLRLYARDNDGNTFQFPVLGARKIADEGNLYALAILVTDSIGYWPTPQLGDDLSIYITWRGLASNLAKFSLGNAGGPVKDDPSARPMPLDIAIATAKKKPDAGGSPEYVGYRWSGDRKRFLEQATFGPTSALDQRIRRIGLRTWLAEQFEAQYPSANNPYPNQPLKPSNAPADCDNNATVPDVPATCFRDTYSMYQPQTWFFKEAFYGDAQLRHRVAWSLAQIWVTSGVDVQQGRHMVEYHKVLSDNAFGNFRDLMAQMTLHPTMGRYLDMAISTKNNPNENYAREIMQLFSIGLFMLNQDGTFQCQEHNPCLPGDTRIPTYDQNVVNDLTKVLTGWSYCNVTASCPNYTPNQGIIDHIDLMLLNTGNHDLTAKTLLSYPGSTTTNIAACAAPCTSVAARTTYANDSMTQALNNIFNHPNVGPFIAKLLIQHLVTSDPTPAYVGRIASVFNDNGLGVRGDMKAVVKAILLDPEARGDVKTDPNFGKLREPVQLATNFGRAFGVTSAAGTGQSDGYIYARGEFSGMAQVPFMSPTVFNFFPPDYAVPGSGIPGPEFAILTTGTSIQRANFFNRMVFTAIPVTVSNPNSPSGTAFNFSDLQALIVSDPSGNSLLDELNQRMLHGTMSSQMRSTILPVIASVTVSNPPTDAQTLNRVRQAVYLVATSSQFQVQR